MTQHKIHLHFPKMPIRFDNNELSFTIDNIKSREASVLYFLVHCYDMFNREIYYDGEVKLVGSTSNVAYSSDRWVIGTEFSMHSTTFDLDQELVNETSYFKVELVLIGIDSENPLYFNKAMLQEGEYDGYHKPSELQTSQLVILNKNIYANLFDAHDNFLQVIRPVGNRNFKTDCLTKNECTVLAPHLNNESDLDNPTNIMIEFVNQTEQTIGIQK